jgi:hypothetical protein
MHAFFVVLKGKNRADKPDGCSPELKTGERATVN